MQMIKQDRERKIKFLEEKRQLMSMYRQQRGKFLSTVDVMPDQKNAMNRTFVKSPEPFSLAASVDS